MNILCTHPGKFGDLLWALPTIRALSRRLGAKIDLLISQNMGSIAPLLSQQDYLGMVSIHPEWRDADCAPVERRMPPEGTNAAYHYDQRPQVIHLGYRDWPKRPLAYETLDTYNSYQRLAEVTYAPLFDADLDLTTPWITVAPDPTARPTPYDWLVGFSDEHFELKYGLTQLLIHPHEAVTNIGRNARWDTEAASLPQTWEESVQLLQHTKVLLACNSSLHVLGVACGVPVVMMEPSEARWNPIFYPVGDTGPQVQLVRGNDGTPTFDARHVRDVLRNTLAAAQAPDIDSATPRKRKE